MTVIDIKVMERLTNELSDNAKLGVKVRELVTNILSTDNDEEKICEDQDI